MTGRIAACVVVVSGSVGLMFLPSTAAERIRAAVRDAGWPGLAALEHIEFRLPTLSLSVVSPPGCDPTELDSLRRRLAESERQARAWQLKAEKLARELDALRRQSELPAAEAEVPPLIAPQLIEAHLYAPGTTDPWIRPWLLDVGEAEGISRHAPLIAPSANTSLSLLDAGSPEQLEPGQRVLWGRCLLGRIAAVGRWTSTVQAVTHPEFRVRVRLQRQVPVRGSLGMADGLLVGTGDGFCRVLLVPSTQAVSVGMDVFTTGGTAPTSVPLYVGRVVEARLGPQAPHWEIRVEPACRLEELDRVQILRAVTNRRRTTTQKVSGNTD